MTRNPNLSLLICNWRERAASYKQTPFSPIEINGVVYSFADVILGMAEALEDAISEAEDDWESDNKRAFIELVQCITFFPDRRPDIYKCTDIIYSAMRLKKACIPMNIRVAAFDFVKACMSDEAKPSWCVFLDGDGIPGY